MRIFMAAILGLAAATATPAVATVMIAEPARQPSACFESAGPCEPQVTPAVVNAATPGNSEPLAPIIPAVVGVLALGLAFVRRQGGMQEVVC